MLNKFSLLLLATLFCLSACVDTSTTEKPIVEKPFFDLKNYFAQEIERLAEKKNVTKIAFYNGKEETKIIKNPNFSNELLIFSNADINRTAWLDKYSVDSIFNTQQELTAINYAALDMNLKTKSVHVEFINNVVSSIEVATAGNSAISQAENYLTYSPTKGYSIKSKQDVKFVSKNDINIQVAF
ncbi:MAG: hypothetical protein ACI85O_000687 [Saprospiraceae bacterium]|jgi:hypothetical protein